MELPNNIKGIMQSLLDNGFEAYVIGGAVRDYLLGVEPHDYDIFTNATGDDILKIFPKGIVLGGEERQKKILTVIVDGVEVSQYRSNGERTKIGTSFEQHINTCDFTVNAMACDINGNIVDLVGGKEDILKQLIMFVGDGDKRIEEDPLRIIRALRFNSKYNFNIKNNSFTSIVSNLNLLETIPKERIKKELEKIMAYSNSIQGLSSIGILNKLFPEFKLTYTMEGGDRHNETVFEHLNESFKTACSVTSDFKLRFAALFHDIGKSNTKEIKDGILTFHGHEEEGEKIFLKYAEKYKFSNEEIKFISFLIRNHMFTYNAEGISNSTMIKFFNKMEAAGVSLLDYITILYCDHQGNLSKPRIGFKDFIEGNFFYKTYNALKKTYPFKVSNLEINGNDLIRLGYIGKDIGAKLNELFELVLEGKIINRKDRLMEELLK